MFGKTPLPFVMTLVGLGAAVACSVYDPSLLPAGEGERPTAGSPGAAGGGGEAGAAGELAGPAGASNGALTAGAGGAAGGGGAPSTAGSAGAGGGPGGTGGADAHPVYCELRPPTYVCLNPGGTFNALAQVYAFGRTDQSAPGGGIEAEFGFGPPGSDPRVSEEGWQFRAAQRDAGFDLSLDHDQYEYPFASDPANATERAFTYLFRFRVDGGAWSYCDRNGAGGVDGLEFFPDDAGYVEVTAEPCSPN